MEVSYAKLKKLDCWGVRIKGDFENVKAGDTVTVTKKDGSDHEEIIDEIVAKFDDAIYCSIKKRESEVD